MPNVFEPDLSSNPDAPAPFTVRGERVGLNAGSRDLGATVYELRRGEAICPLHVHYANEEMIIVLAGRPTLRTLEGSRELSTGEVVACLPGRAGAHRVDNFADEPARVLIVSTMRWPELAEYPDSDKFLVRTGDRADPDSKRMLFRPDPGFDYFDGEA